MEPLRRAETNLLNTVEETARLLSDKAYLEGLYRAGAEKAQAVAQRTLRKVHKKVGFLPR